MTIQENIARWNRPDHWFRDGENWSDWWGGSKKEWKQEIWPRIERFVPTDNILEIGVGHGRWTDFLLKLAKNYLFGIDSSRECIEFCSDRFLRNNCSFLLNDGLLIPGLRDGLINFCFSHSALVHCEMDVMESYIKELARVLAPGGAAWLHHSNLGAFPGAPDPHLRARSVTAELVKQAAERQGFKVEQELVRWGGGPIECDCYTTLVKP